MVLYVVLLFAILSAVVFVQALVIGLAIAIIGFQSWKATKGMTSVLSEVGMVNRIFLGTSGVLKPSAATQTFKEWAFCVELALGANDISDGASQTDFASSHLEGNASLWYLSCVDSG